MVKGKRIGKRKQGKHGAQQPPAYACLCLLMLNGPMLMLQGKHIGKRKQGKHGAQRPPAYA
eukprot:1144155-Pelagomonas_calceolata.AAC.1